MGINHKIMCIHRYAFSSIIKPCNIASPCRDAVVEAFGIFTVSMNLSIWDKKVRQDGKYNSINEKPSKDSGGSKDLRTRR